MCLLNKNWVLVIGALILSLVSFLRYTTTGSYYSSTLSYYNLNYTETFYQSLLRFIPQGFEVVFSITLGIVVLYLFGLLLESFNLSDKHIFISLLLVVISPAWIYTYTNMLPQGVAYLFLILALLFYVKNSYFYLLALSLISLFSPVLFTLAILGFFVFGVLFKRKVFELLLLPLILVHGLGVFFEFSIKSLDVYKIFVELGFLNSISFVTLCFGLLSFAMFYERKKINVYLALILGSSFILSVLYQELVFFSVLMFSVLAAKYYIYLLTTDFSIKELKFYTNLLIICLYLFVFISFVVTSSNVDLAKIDALKELESYPAGKVLSLEDNGYLIEYYAGMPSFINENSYKYNSYPHKLEFLDEVFYSFRASEVSRLFREENLSYLLVTKDMFTGKVWTSRQDGLLFVAENSESFLTLYDDGEVVIYEFVS